jgi:hypothetical protein
MLIMKTAEFPSELTSQFYAALKKLVGFPTCFWRDDIIADALAFCSNAMELLPDHWVNNFDEAGNLLVYNILMDSSKPILYLSSHIDVVGAKGADWLTPPFTAIETDEYIIGRGVNDCKAGTALQMMLAWLLAEEDSRGYNVGFFFMFREEGNKGKTSSQLDFSCLPVSNAGTYFITLENTVQLHNDRKFTLGVYNREPHNLFISCKGLLDDLVKDVDLLEQLDWKPVNLYPLGDEPTESQLKGVLVNHQNGHTATIPTEANPLKKVLKEFYSCCGCISTGCKGQSSVISPSISMFNGAPLMHELVYNYRGFGELDKIRSDLSWLDYEETYGFEIGRGSDQSSHFNSSPMAAWVSELATQDIQLNLQANPGRSDASAIWNILSPEQQEYIIPFAMGPGCRTHTDGQGVRRATHGNDEGFYKPVAPVIIEAFLKLLAHFKHPRR